MLVNTLKGKYYLLSPGSPSKPYEAAGTMVFEAYFPVWYFFQGFSQVPFQKRSIMSKEWGFLRCFLSYFAGW